MWFCTIKQAISIPFVLHNGLLASQLRQNCSILDRFETVWMASFWLTLGSPLACPRAETRRAMPNRSRHQILLVDDEKSVRESIAMLLTSVGYDVATAHDGFDALLHLK